VKYFFNFIRWYNFVILNFKRIILNCFSNIIFVWLVWFSLSIFVYGVTDFFRAIMKRNEKMNLFNSYLYEIVFMSVFLIMVFADALEDRFFTK